MRAAESKVVNWTSSPSLLEVAALVGDEQADVRRHVGQADLHDLGLLRERRCGHAERAHERARNSNEHVTSPHEFLVNAAILMDGGVTSSDSGGSQRRAVLFRRVDLEPRQHLLAEEAQAVARVVMAQRAALHHE
jgi:hypothetical protein